MSYFRVPESWYPTKLFISDRQTDKRYKENSRRKHLCRKHKRLLAPTYLDMRNEESCDEVNGLTLTFNAKTINLCKTYVEETDGDSFHVILSGQLNSMRSSD